MRNFVYPGLVTRGKMTDAESDYRIRCLDAAIATWPRC